jgi:Protein of unknown function (DUF2934)/Pentapeptide repeats (8 copies)
MEVLTAFVRERMRYTTVMARLSERAYFLWLQAGRPEGRSQEFWTEAVRLERLERTPTDIGAILTVIDRRSAEDREREEDNEWYFDLSGAYLRGAYLEEFDLKYANLSGACLEGAVLLGARLEGADLNYAHLERATLSLAHLEGAWLEHAHLEGAWIGSAHLDGAHLDYAHLEGALLGDTHLEGASLWGASGLSDDQLRRAFGDKHTILPGGNSQPEHWWATPGAGLVSGFSSTPERPPP